MSSTEAPQQKVRYVKKGTGGALAINKNDTRRIGVVDCNTSVGVYFKIDSRRVFCAHMQCTWETISPMSEPSEAQADSVREHFVNKLIETATQEEWPIGGSSFGHDMTVVCQHTYDVPGKGVEQRYLSWYVVAGVHDFFGAVARHFGGKKLIEDHYSEVFTLDEPHWRACDMRPMPERKVDGVLPSRGGLFELPGYSFARDPFNFSPLPHFPVNTDNLPFVEALAAAGFSTYVEDGDTFVDLPAMYSANSGHRGRSRVKKVRSRSSSQSWDSAPSKSRSPTNHTRNESQISDPKPVFHPEAKFAQVRASAVGALPDYNGFLMDPFGNPAVTLLGKDDDDAVRDAEIRVGTGDVRSYEPLLDGEWNFIV